MDLGRKDYNLIDTSPAGIPEMEPGMLFRAQDELGATIADIYAVLAESHGLWEVARSARQQAEKMRLWPTKKRADL